MRLPADTVLTAPDDSGAEWEFDCRDDLATADVIAAVAARDGLPPVVLVQLSSEDRFGIALSAEAARDFASALMLAATKAIQSAPAAPTSASSDTTIN